jgi:hypothetical protein
MIKPLGPGGLCAAGGSFTNASGLREAWVRTRVRGRWQAALAVPGIAGLHTGDGPVTGSWLSTVACATAGNCAAGGGYQFGCATPGNPCGACGGLPCAQPYVVTEHNGTWAPAMEVPGIEQVNEPSWADGNTTLVACPSAGNCTAAGYYQNEDPDYCETVAVQPSWANAVVPAQPQPPVGDCDSSFAVNQRDGTWGQYSEVVSQTTGLACPAAGDCVVVGSYTDWDTIGQPTFGNILSETSGKWGGGVSPAGTNTVNLVACASPGYCAAVGSTTTPAGFLISEWHGTWGQAIGPGGLPSNAADQLNAVACPPRVTLCIVGGNETTPKGGTQAFIVSQTE